MGSATVRAQYARLVLRRGAADAASTTKSHGHTLGDNILRGIGKAVLYMTRHIRVTSGSHQGHIRVTSGSH
eukprot:11047191-Karenia_brevis.AAC.1